MAVESLTVTLGVDDHHGKIKGEDLTGGDKNDNQIVTVEDGGNLSGTYTFEEFGKGTPTEPGAGPGGDDLFIFDLSAFDDDFDIAVKSFDAGDIFQFNNWDTMTTVGTVTTITYTGSDGLVHTVTIDAQSSIGVAGVDVVQVVCFARGTVIDTEIGPVPVEQLCEGDLVLCGDGSSRPILWIGSRRLDAQALRLHPELAPVSFAPDAFGPGRPGRRLRLSPQHRVLLRDWRAELLFGEAEVFVSALQMVNDSSIRVESDCCGVEYFHILLEAHHTVFANGVECETLMPAELSQSALPSQARSEILTIFPELAGDLGAYGPTRHMTLKGHGAQALMAQALLPGRA
jgi:Hint domain-containing protein